MMVSKFIYFEHKLDRQWYPFFHKKAIYNTKIMESMEKKVKSKIIGLKKIMAHLGYDLRVSAT